MYKCVLIYSWRFLKYKLLFMNYNLPIRVTSYEFWIIIYQSELQIMLSKIKVTNQNFKLQFLKDVLS